jgi:hypothetical protein
MVEPLPPPPPPRPDLSAWNPPSPPRAGWSRGPIRPQLLTVAGWILIVTGAIGGLAGLILLLARAQDLASLGTVGDLQLDRVGRGLGLLSLVIGALQVVSGILVLRLSNAGRVLGITLAILGVIGGLGMLGSGTGVVGIGLNGFVLYALIANAAAFQRTRAG